MAASSVSPMKPELPPKPTQELSKITGDQLPDRYIHQFPETAADHSAIKYMDNPIIDLNLLSAVSTHQPEELQKLRSSLSSWGCFQVCFDTFNTVQSFTSCIS